MMGTIIGFAPPAALAAVALAAMGCETWNWITRHRDARADEPDYDDGRWTDGIG